MKGTAALVNRRRCSRRSRACGAWRCATTRATLCPRGAGAARGRKVNWAEKFFDLVVVDEASQMGLAEALTAGAFLRDDGQFIAVGDHRQMPPILAHAWDREARRDIRRARPHLSVFEDLL